MAVFFGKHNNYVVYREVIHGSHRELRKPLCMERSYMEAIDNSVSRSVWRGHTWKP